MKEDLINALYLALMESKDTDKDIIGNQDKALQALYDDRIAPHINDDNLLGDLSEIMETASRAAFAKAFEAMAALTEN